MDDVTSHGAPVSPDLLNFPWGPPADAVPHGPIETSSDSRGAEGEGGVGACHSCPNCRINDYLKAHGEVVTEVVDCGEGVWLGPDVYSFDPDIYAVILDLPTGIAVVAVERDNDEALSWVMEQRVMFALRKAGLHR